MSNLFLLDLYGLAILSWSLEQNKRKWKCNDVKDQSYKTFTAVDYDCGC
jgi:hypothetical protein